MEEPEPGQTSVAQGQEEGLEHGRAGSELIESQQSQQLQPYLIVALAGAGAGVMQVCGRA